MNRTILVRKHIMRLSFICIFIFSTIAAFAQSDVPWSQNTSPLGEPTGFVNDYANVIDAATKQRLETRLREFRDRTNPSVEIAVAVVRTTGERAIYDYSLAVARGWGIGSKQDDNPSALLFIAVDDRKYFTQISKDLEGDLPDGLAGSIQRQYLVPEFRKGNYAKGIEDTVEAYIATIEGKGNIAGQPQRSAPAGETDSGDGMFGVFCCAVIFIVLLLMFIGRGKRGGPSNKDRDRWGGDGGGGDMSVLPWIIGGILSGGSGGSSSSSSDWDWGSSGGSGWGGFGGGGDFGGGGAGGDW